MSDESTQRNRQRFWLAALGLVVMLGSVFVWLLFLDNSFLRRTALPFWLTMVFGVSLGTVASWQVCLPKTSSVPKTRFSGTSLVI